MLTLKTTLCKITLFKNGNPIIIIMILTMSRTTQYQSKKCKICLIWKCKNLTFCMVITTNKVIISNKILTRMRMLTTSYHSLIVNYWWGHLTEIHCFNQNKLKKSFMELGVRGSTKARLNWKKVEVVLYPLDKLTLTAPAVAVKKTFTI